MAAGIRYGGRMKQDLSHNPPMGGNSRDCHDASVTEDEVRGNTVNIAEYLKPSCWEYAVVYIRWYGLQARSSAHIVFYPLESDGFSRLIPAVNRFPSLAGGMGFGPLAALIHSLGLKFGIHIMRGIPRQAVQTDTPISGIDIRARSIAHTSSICTWNTDMHGIDASRPGTRQYIESLVDLYASRGVDFLKVDDISHPCRADEIELFRNAIAIYWPDPEQKIILTSMQKNRINGNEWSLPYQEQYSWKGSSQSGKT